MPTINKERHQTAYGKPRPRLRAWLRESNAHGLVYYDLIFLPEDDEPEEPKNGEFIRAHWLDEPNMFDWLYR